MLGVHGDETNKTTMGFTKTCDDFSGQNRERERVNHQTWGYDGDLMTVIKMGLKGCLMGIS